jgi:hypothetical protein
MRQMLFSIEMSEQGPKMTVNCDRQFLLRMLAGVMEDIRQEAMIERLRQEASQVQVVGAMPHIGKPNGVG